MPNGSLRSLPTPLVLLLLLAIMACASRAVVEQEPTADHSAPPSGETARLALGPMVGHATNESVRFWVQGAGPAELEATVLEPDGETESQTITLTEADAFTGVVEVGDLDPRMRYTAELALDGRPVDLDSPISFRTFPLPGQPIQLRIAVVSCARVAWDSVQPIWARIAADRPDVVLWLGDNNYFEDADSIRPADYGDPVLMEAKYAELRRLPALQPLLRQAVHYAIWDDHDYADEQPDRTWPLKEEVDRLFERFWANPSYGGEGTDGIWSAVTMGDVELFLTDGRFYRDPDDKPDGPSKTMLGEVQKRWLKERLATSTARIKLVAIGVQVLADYHQYDGYHIFAHERRELMQWIRERRIEGVVFLTGDRHLTELMRDPDRVGYPLYELTASPVANRFFATGLEQPNPIRIGGYAAGFNYGLLDIDTTRAPGRLVFRVKDAEGREVLTHEVSLADLTYGPHGAVGQ